MKFSNEAHEKDYGGGSRATLYGAFGFGEENIMQEFPFMRCEVKGF